MSIVKDEKELEYWSDQKLLEEAQTPTGRMPLFLIHTQIEKRKNYRASANARKETPATSIYEEDVAEFGGGGLGSMQQQMPMSPPPNQQMPPPQQMPMSAGPPQAGMGVAPMNRGGQLPEHISLAALSPNTNRGNLTKKQLEEEEKRIRSYKSNLKLSPMARGGLIRAQTGRRLPMENEASQVAAQGRYGDSTLVHMNPIEVAMMNRNGDLTTNPKTGLKEAWAPLLPLLMGAGRGALGYAGRSGAARSLAGMRSRLPTWLGGRKPITDPKRLLGHKPGTALQSRQQLMKRTPGWQRGLGAAWGSMKKHPIYWGLGGLGAFSGLRGLADEDELPVNYGGGSKPPPDAGTVTTPPPNLTELSEGLYGTFLQPEEGYEEELTKAESYRRTPEQRKAEAQGIAFSGLAKALSNVGMENIISGVADVTPDVMALRKYQTEEERVVDKNVADLKRMRRGDKATAMQAAMEWEKVKNQKSYYEQQGELGIYDAAQKAWGAQMSPPGVPGHISFDTYIHFYRTGEWLGPGGGSAQGDFDEAGLAE
jgi:hypothetical protein